MRRLGARHLGLMCLLMCLVLVGCSVEATLSAPHCSSAGSAIIVAQSVPTASKVPCLDPLPDGWSVSTVSVNQDRSVITFDSDRAGEAAATLRFEAECQVEGAVRSVSEHPDTLRFDDILRLPPGFRARRFYRFEGGCVSWEFDFAVEASSTEAIGLGDSLRLVPRQEISDDLSEMFDTDEL